VSSKAIHAEQHSFEEFLHRMLTELFLHGIAGFWFHFLPLSSVRMTMFALVWVLIGVTCVLFLIVQV
jgi:hypothetical protein